MSADLGGAVVVITGASSGIGRATARAFAEEGADLILAARGNDNLQEVGNECRERGARVVCLPTDVCDEEQVAALMQAAVDEFGRIDVCVVNASVYAYGTFEATPSEVFKNVIDTNLVGAANTARQALPQMREQGAGSLIFIGSVYSRITSPYVSAYVASKFGLYGFVRVLRQELRKARGIHVSLVLPATIDTPIYQHAANYTGHHVHPLPPVVHPERVAQAILRSAKAPRAVTIVGAVQRTLIPVHALLPRLYDVCVGPLMNLVALRRGRVAPHPGTVFAPARGANTVTGGWGRLGRLHRSTPPKPKDHSSSKNQPATNGTTHHKGAEMNSQQDGMKELAKIVKDADIAILTTVNAHGQLVSRPLAVQDTDFDGDLWFFTDDPSPKADEIRANPQVNVSISSGKGYVSIAGTATLTKDRAKIDELWSASVKPWFDGKDDPKIALIKVDGDTAEYWSLDTPRVVAAIKIAKGMVSGDRPDPRKNEVVDL